MKKTIYFLLFALASSMSFISCTEEDVKPSNDLKNGGTGVLDPKRTR